MNDLLIAYLNEINSAALATVTSRDTSTKPDEKER